MFLFFVMYIINFHKKRQSRNTWVIKVLMEKKSEKYIKVKLWVTR